ncbi:MAG: hypothetical protein BGO31_03020 [Bacteroidetes bacterium 43-16]|nr:MAG: hypothetical protein BGO31_03020 [Bacteroidetes bacterium 43-16]
MKSIPILLCFAGLAGIAQAQLSTGATGITIKSGTVFSAEGLTLTPDTDISLQNQTISFSATPATAGSGATISKVYTINPALTFSGTLGIKYTAAELNGNLENTLDLVKADGSGTFTAFNSSTTGSAGTYYVSAPGLSNVSLNRLSATSASVPLPLRYDDFKVVSGPGCASLLSWNGYKASVSNFAIERSGDGKHYEALSLEIHQDGNHFFSRDTKLLKDKNFYRLALSERGEEVVYSNVVSIHNTCLLAETNIYPNPAGKNITISLAAAPEHIATIDLLDISGKQILSFKTSLQTSTLDLKSVAAGTYLLKVQEGVNTEYIKFVKQ